MKLFRPLSNDPDMNISSQNNQIIISKKDSETPYVLLLQVLVSTLLARDASNFPAS